MGKASTLPPYKVSNNCDCHLYVCDVAIEQTIAREYQIYGRSSLIDELGLENRMMGSEHPTVPG